MPLQDLLRGEFKSSRSVLPSLSPTSPRLRSGQHLLKMENALLDLIDVLIVVAIGFAIIMVALPPAYGGLGLRK
jgi:hypothetical protein